MKQNDTTKLSARINKFLDRKLAKSFNVNQIENFELRRSHKQFSDVNDSQFIALAIK